MCLLDSESTLVLCGLLLTVEMRLLQGRQLVEMWLGPRLPNTLVMCLLEGVLGLGGHLRQCPRLVVVYMWLPSAFGCF
jgi:hypothetical protein